MNLSAHLPRPRTVLLTGLVLAALSACGGGDSVAAEGGGSPASVAGAVSVPSPTLENLSVEWAFSGDANANAQVTVRFRPLGASVWKQAQPLRRVPGGSNAGYTWTTRHSGSIFDLTPASTYEIELTLTDPDGGSTTRTVQARTRAVPQPMSGAPVKPATPSTLAAVLAAAVPGDIVELAAGSYAAPTLSRDGSADKPLVLRAATGLDPSAVVLNGELGLIGRQHVQVRGLTVNGRIRYNGSTGVAIVGNRVFASASVGNGDGIVSYTPSQDAYIADNTVVGTTTWGEAALGVNGANLGEGILVNGPGHVVMNNRVRGFRDNISLLEGEQALTQYSIDILNNDLSEAADDAIEADYCHHNCRILRNRITNAFVGISSQPSLGGPTWFVRNVLYNIAHVAFKLYNGSTGDQLVHNTVVKNGDAFGLYPGQPIRQLWARNNLFIGGPGGTYAGFASGTGAVAYLYDLDMATASLDHDAYGSTTDAFSGRVGPSVRFASLAELRSSTSEKNAVAVDLGVFATAVAFPGAPMTTYAPPDLRLAPGVAAAASGLALSNLNDGYPGAAPAAGAYEVGQALPVYGPR